VGGMGGVMGRLMTECADRLRAVNQLKRVTYITDIRTKRWGRPSIQVRHNSKTSRSRAQEAAGGYLRVLKNERQSLSMVPPQRDRIAFMSQSYFFILFATNGEQTLEKTHNL
jgi:hypothetical protein